MPARAASPLRRASHCCEHIAPLSPATMRFMIGDVEVFFPYKYIYKEQHEYMKELYVSAVPPCPCLTAPVMQRLGRPRARPLCTRCW